MRRSVTMSDNVSCPTCPKMPANHILSRWLGTCAAPLPLIWPQGGLRPFILSVLLICPLVAGAGRTPGWQFPVEHRLAPTFVEADLHGRPVRLDDYRGQTLLLHFWATWCGPCIVELPALQALEASCDPRQLSIVTVAADPGDSQPVERFVQEHGLTLPVIHANNLALRRAWEIRVLPTTYLIGPDGLIVARLIGAGDWHSDELLNTIRRTGVNCR